jgi:hypothetical protein
MLTLRPLPSALAAALCSLLALPPSRADDTLMQRVLIDGSRASQLGIADAAGDGSVTQHQLAARTTYRPGVLLEATPGLIVSQHSGEGKANQFYLRGFNLDHGTDLRTTVDGMPVNQRSHAHGQGWTDLNFLIPELAARLDYKKGPYSAEEGDFASAGAASIVYANRLVRGVASASVGQNGYRRALLADSVNVNPERSGALLYALEAMHNDGPYTRGDDYRKLNGVLRYTEGYANNGFSVTAMAYQADWNATDQIPLRAVRQGLLGRYDGIDNTDGGKAHRYSLSGTWQRSGEDSATKVHAYLIANRLDLYSNFTYFMDDPVNGDQFAQPDRRVTSGVDASHAWHAHIGAASSVTTAGLRADGYRFDVRPALPGSASALAHPAARASDRLLSPSLSAVFGPWAQTELYANAGSGFHSNDARGPHRRDEPWCLHRERHALEPVAALDGGRAQRMGAAPAKLALRVPPGLRLGTELRGRRRRHRGGRPEPALRRGVLQLLQALQMAQRGRRHRLRARPQPRRPGPRRRRRLHSRRGGGRGAAGADGGQAGSLVRRAAFALLRPAPAHGGQQRTFARQPDLERPHRLPLRRRPPAGAGSVQPGQPPRVGHRLLLRLPAQG